MRRTALAAAVLLLAVACGDPTTVATTPPEDAGLLGAGSETSATSGPSPENEAGFPVIVEADNGPVAVDERPGSIVSLSAVATEMLFAIGAGPQVVAVDDQSNHPPEAPTTDLSGFTPNLEAILSYEPDLVIITFDPGDVIDGLEASGVPVLSFTAAGTIEDVYRQMEQLGAATGNAGSAATETARVRAELREVVAGAGGIGGGVTYYHEIDSTFYTATSSTFFGEIYGLFGMVNIADPADEDGSAFGYPQLSSEFIVASDPDIIFLSNTLYGESASTVAERPGWEVLSAVQRGDVVELDSDIASRWGPRIVEFAESVVEAVQQHQAR